MRLIFVLIDGLSANGLKYMPNLQKVMKEEFSISSNNVEPQKCSITHPNMFSILTGLSMEQHGMKTNDLSYEYHEKEKFKEIFHKIYPSRLNIYADDDGIDDFFELCLYKPPKIVRIKNLKEAFSKLKRTVSNTIIYTQKLDIAGHEYGWMSSEYIKELKNIDNELDFFLTPIEKDDIVFICSDHGGIGLQHRSKQCTNMKTYSYSYTDKRLKTIACVFKLNHAPIKGVVLEGKPKTNTLTKEIFTALVKTNK